MTFADQRQETLQQGHHIHRYRLVSRGADTQPAIAIPAPARDPAARGRGADVTPARGDGGDTLQRG